MIATEGLGENQPAHGFLFIVGNSTELLAPDPDLSFAETESSVHSKYGFFPKDLDRRDGWILIQNCTNSDVEKRVLQTLCACHNAIVIDGKSGQVCCGGFANRDSMTPYGTGSRTRAASSIAVRANCVTIKASEDICGTRANPVPPDAHFEVFRGDYYPERVPVVKENEPPSLESQLRPLSFKGELEWHIKQFVPGTRDWILDFLISWVRNPNGPRCCVLLAGPGFGKTAIVAQLYSLLGEDVLIAVHLIRYNNAGKRDPCRMIKSLAYQIAQVLPEYRKNVEEVLRAGSCDLNDIVQLVDCLTLEPLASIERPAGGRLLIVIDALDEAEHATKNHLLDLIAREFPKLPPWVAVLVTSRPELTVQTKLATLRPKFLDSEENAKECDVDVRRFLRAILAPVVDPERLEATITTAAAKAEGLFLYLYWLRKRLEDEPHADIEEIPDGLAGTYLAEFTRVFPGGFSIDCRKVLGAILAASEPLRIKDIPGLSGVSRCEDIVWMLSQLFPARNDACIRVLNESLAGWLMGEFPFENRSDVDPYFIDYVTSHRRAAAACLATLVRELDGPRNLNNESDAHAAAVIRASLTGIGDDDHELLAPVDYALRWAVTHLVAAKLQHVALALLCSLRFVTLRVEAGQMADLVVDSTKVPGGEASLLHQALFLSQNRVRVFGCAVLAEELWQRTLEAAGHGATMMALSRLARDAEQTARATPPFKLTCVLEGHGGGVCGVAGFETRESEPRLASCSLDGTVRVWDPKVGREILKLEGHQSSVRGVVVFKTSDGTRLLLASCSNDCTVHVWDPVECRQLRILDGHEDEVNCVTAFEMKDATCLASCSSDGTINVWDPVAGQQIRKLEDQEGSVLSVVALKLSDENICLASCSSDGTVRVRDATTEARQIRVLEGHEGKVWSVVAFVASDGPRLASCSDDSTVRIWNPTKAPHQIHKLEGHTASVFCIAAFSTGNGLMLLASGSGDGTVRVWTASDALLLCVLSAHNAPVLGLVTCKMSGGTPLLVSSSSDQTIRVWEPGENFDQLCEKARREFHRKFLCQALDRASVPWRRARLMVVGQGRVGKTSLFKRLKGEKFDEHERSTRGAERSDVSALRDQGIEKSDVAITRTVWRTLSEVGTEGVSALAAGHLSYDSHAGRPSSDEAPGASGVKIQGTTGRSSTSVVAERRDLTTKQESQIESTETKKQEISLKDEDVVSLNFEPRGDGSSEEELSTETTARLTFRGSWTAKLKGDRYDESEILDKSKNERELRISVWDYGGQEAFHVVHNKFLSRKGVFLAVFNMVDWVDGSSPNDEVGKIAREQLAFWLNSIAIHARGAPVFLVGTHCDAISDDARTKISHEVDSVIAGISSLNSTIVRPSEKGLAFYAVDNKVMESGNPVFGELRTAIEDAICQDTDRYIHEPVPLIWLETCDELQRACADEDLFFAGINAVRDLLRKCYAKKGQEPLGNDEVYAMLKLFDELGVITHFGSTHGALAENIVILEPQWIIDMFTAVIRNFEWHKMRRDMAASLGGPDTYDAGVGEVLWYDLTRKGILDQRLLDHLWPDSECHVDDNILGDNITPAQVRVMVLEVAWRRCAS